MTPQQQEIVELKVELMNCHIKQRKLVEALRRIVELDPLTQGDIAVRLAGRALEEE